MSALIRSIKDALSFMSEHGFWKSLRMKKAPWLIQFGKYGMCGVGAVVVHNAIVIYLSLREDWFPAVGSLIADDGVRAKNQVINNLIVFPISNVFAYVTNSIWVFTGGRHSRVVEFSYFTIISLFSFVAGLLGGPLLVKLFGVPFFVSQLGFIVTSAMVNYACRKFIIFKG
ncbi:MAG: putative flippase GtrA [Verrucomicrobiales bacterium]|jgi:putative flippase GtrA